MKKYLISLTILCSLVSGCMRDNETGEAGGGGREVSLTICASPVDVTTRGVEVDEERIDNLNVYAFSTIDSRRYHTYTTDLSALELRVTVGTYDVYVIANMPGDMGDMTRAELLAARESLSQRSDLVGADCLPMSATRRITVTPSSGAESFTVKRNVAKITYNITVDPAVQSIIMLDAVQVSSIPSSGPLFGRGGAKATEYVNEALVPLDGAHRWALEFILSTLEVLR